MRTMVIPTDAETVLGPKQGEWTLSDWERLPEDGNRYEIIDGFLYMSTAPSFFHQWIGLNFYHFVGYPAREQGLAITALAPVGVIMVGAKPVQPDIVVVRMARKDIIRDRRIYGVPDLIVEVLSPGSETYDTETKLHTYAEAGVPEYGIVNPAERTLALYTLLAVGQYAEPQVFSEMDSMTFACLPGITLQIRDLFDGAPDTTL